MNIASFTKRTFAYLIDLVLTILLPMAAFVLGYIFWPEFQSIPIYFVIMAFVVIAWLIYFVFCSIYMAISNGRTVGLAIMGLRVIHQDLKRISFGESLARCAACGLLIMVIVNAFYVVGTKTEKSVFDRLTNTLTVDWKNRSK